MPLLKPTHAYTVKSERKQTLSRDIHDLCDALTQSTDPEAVAYRELRELEMLQWKSPGDVDLEAAIAAKREEIRILQEPEVLREQASLQRTQDLFQELETVLAENNRLIASMES